MRRQVALATCLLIVLYTGLTLLFTYPLATHLATHHVGTLDGDAPIYLWNYWWLDKALFELGSSPFETDWIFHPIGIGLALHTLAASQGLAAAVLGWVVGPVVAANVVILWTFVASALFTYALARRLGAGTDGAFLAGLVFAYCPYRLARLSGHYDLLGTEWIPLFALALVAVCERERFAPGLAAATGAVAAVAGYTALSYLAFLGIFTLGFAALHERRLRALVPRLAVVGAVTLALTAPLWLQMADDLSRWSYEPYPGADRYVADLAAFVVPPPNRTFLAGAWFGDNLTESIVFPGYLVLLLAAAGRPRREWLGCGAIFFVLSLGSSLHVAGTDTHVPLPFALLARIPVLDNLRAPSRFIVVTMLCLAVLLALAWRPKARRWTALAALGITLEFLSIPIPLFGSEVPAVYARIAEDPAVVTVAEVPGIEQSPARVMNHQRFHGKPVFVGFAARVPVEKSEYWFGLPLVRPLIELRKGRLSLDDDLLQREREHAPAVARFLGLGYLVLDKAYAKRGVVRFASEVLPVDVAHEDESTVLLRVRRDELPPDPIEIGANSPASRQHFEAGWMRPEGEAGSAFRWAHRERSTLLFRPPPGATRVTLTLAPLEGVPQTVRAEIEGRDLGATALDEGWNAVSFDLPDAPGVLRLTLSWSALETASARDPRRLAARIRELRFEP